MTSTRIKDKNFIKTAYILLNKFQVNKKEMEEQLFIKNYGLEVETAKLLKAKNIISDLKNRLDDANNKITSNCDNLDDFFKGYAEQLSEQRKKDLMKQYDENSIDYF